MNKAIISVYQLIINTLFWLILFFLIFLSFISTSYITPDFVEKTYFLRDSIKVNILALILLFLVLFFFRRTNYYKSLNNRLSDDKTYKKYYYILLFIIFLISLLFVLNTQSIPGDDQLFIQEAATAFKENDYHMFNEKGYLARFPNQVPLVFISYLFALLFGYHNYLAFQIINVFGIVLFYKELIDISEILGLNRLKRLEVLFIGILFLPLIFYCGFVYGNILGLAFSVLAIKYQLRYYETNNIKDLILCLIGICLGVWFKQNYLIFFIGIFIHSLIVLIKDKALIKLLMPVLLIITFLFANNFPFILARSISHEKLDQGTSSYAWIAMGMQESGRAPGWFNGYNWDNYTDSNFNKEKSTYLAKVSIKERAEYFLSNPDEMIWFFTLKVASSWNNPTFQGLWVNQVREHNVEFNELTYYLLSPQGERHIYNYLNILNMFILVGVILYISLDKNKDINKSLLPMIIVGGFFFHLLWEAKCQYTLSYFVLFFPYTIEGFSLFLERIELFINNPKEYINDNKKNIILFVLQFIILLIITVLILKPIHDKKDPYYLANQSLEQAHFYHKTNTSPAIKEGIHKIYINDEEGLSVINGELKISKNNISDIRVEYYNGITTLYLIDEGKYICHNEEGKVYLTSNYEKENMKWYTKINDYNMLYIAYNEDGLSYNEYTNEFYLEKFNNAGYQFYYVK